MNMLYAYVICYKCCFIYMLYMYMLYRYVIFICYVNIICIICIYVYIDYDYSIIERNAYKTLIYSCDLFSLMLLLQFETMFLTWFLPFSLISLIIVFCDGSSIFVTVIFFFIIRVTVVIYKRWKKIFVISEISQRYKGWWSFIIIIYLMSMTASIF